MFVHDVLENVGKKQAKFSLVFYDIIICYLLLLVLLLCEWASYWFITVMLEELMFYLWRIKML